MKNSQKIATGIAMMIIILAIGVKKYDRNSKNNTSGSHPACSDEMNLNQGEKNQGDYAHPGSDTTQAPSTNGAGKAISASGNGQDSEKLVAVKKENNCFSYSYQHQSKNQSRDIEEFLNDTNAFPVLHTNVNQKSICIKVNEKPTPYKFSKKGDKSELIIGSVVGPESTIQVSYCVGNAPCKESCAVKSKNKVDELLSDTEMGGIENAELETQVKELRNVASTHEDLMDSTVIRDWNQLKSKEWVCER